MKNIVKKIISIFFVAAISVALGMCVGWSRREGISLMNVGGYVYLGGDLG